MSDAALADHRHDLEINAALFAFDVIFSTKSEEITFWNHAAANWFNFQDGAGKKISEVVAASNTNGRLQFIIDAGERFAPGAAHRVQHGEQSILLKKIITSDGHSHHITYIIRDISLETSKVLEADVLYQSLEQQKKILDEKLILLQSILDNSPDFIAVLDKSLKYILLNKSFASYLAPHVGDITGKTVAEALPQHRTSPYRDVLERAGKGEASVMKNYSYSYRDGFCDLHTYPLTNETGEVFGILQMTTDVSELRELNAQLNEKNEKLQEMNMGLATFAAVANHDLKKPLNKIQILADFLQKRESSNLSDSGKEYLRRLMTATSDAQSIMTGTIDYYSSFRLDGPSGSLLLSEAVANARMKLDIAEEMIELSGDTILLGNVKHLQTIVESIVGNSVKFASPERPLQIRIGHELVIKRTAPGRAEKTFLVLTFEDNGIGFSEDFNEKVFEVFFRIHGHHAYPGNGIGLSICKKIVGNMGGMITAEGQMNRGVKVTVTLPQENRLETLPLSI